MECRPKSVTSSRKKNVFVQLTRRKRVSASDLLVSFTLMSLCQMDRDKLTPLLSSRLKRPVKILPTCTTHIGPGDKEDQDSKAVSFRYVKSSAAAATHSNRSEYTLIHIVQNFWVPCRNIWLENTLIGALACAFEGSSMRSRVIGTRVNRPSHIQSTRVRAHTYPLLSKAHLWIYVTANFLRMKGKKKAFTYFPSTQNIEPRSDTNIET